MSIDDDTCDLLSLDLNNDEKSNDKSTIPPMLDNNSTSLNENDTFDWTHHGILKIPSMMETSASLDNDCSQFYFANVSMVFLSL